VAVEAGVRFGWERYVGRGGIVLGIDTFGESAPYKDVLAHFGLTVDAVVVAVNKQLGARNS
jgi:transketolase